MPVVPRNYEEWKHCITVECGIPLTQDFVAERIRVLNDASDHETQKFIKRWGEAHHARTVAWFREAQEQLAL